MPRRILFPGLRKGLEAKSLTLSGSGIRTGLGSRTFSYGMRDSSAGWDMDTVVMDGYERVVWVYKAVEIIAGNASRLKFQITEDEDEVEGHPLLRVMNKRANPLETGRQFRKRLSAQVLLSKKGAFVEATTSRGGNLTRCDILDPTRVRIIPDPAGDYVDYFEFTQPNGVVRNLDPSKVRWIREPHPLDPFSGVTPLEAAGMSVQLDRLAREYNVNFINRDGRPGGIVGIDTEGVPAGELDRIARLFEPGVNAAGKINAIGTGKGGMTYIDTASRPRDMAYETTSDKAKKEILAAFGVPESIAGDASERTFDNAAQETFTFWHEVMIPHLGLVSSAFDGDVPETYDCDFDTSEIEALEMPARRRRAEARDEFNAGLRSIKEYRELRPELEEVDNPQTRALWVSPAKAPVPTNPEDADDLGLSAETPGAGPAGSGPQAGAPAGATPDGSGPTGPVPGETAAEVVAALSDRDVAGDPPPPPGSAAEAVYQATSGQGEESVDTLGPAAQAVLQAQMEGKALPPDQYGRSFVIVPDAPPSNGFEAGEDELRKVELAVTAVLEATLARQAGVVTSKLQSPKTRKGTPYWVAEGPEDINTGDEPIDAARVVDGPRWAGEVQETLLPIAMPATQQAANDLLTTLAESGALTLPAVAAAVVAGRTVQAAVPSPEQIGLAAAQAAVSPAMLAVAAAVEAVKEWQADRVDDLNRILADQHGAPDLTLLVEAVRKLWTDHVHPWAQTTAITVAQAAVTGGRDSAAASVTPQPVTPAAGQGAMVEIPPEVTRIWRTRDDERVRAAHRAANGQRVGVGEFFVVGGQNLRFPSDPLAPPSVARNCRCWVRYEWSQGAKFTLPVAPGPAAAAA